MIAFIDSSVVLRMLFGEPNSLQEWSSIEDAYASRLLPLETARVIDRCRLNGQITDEDVANLHSESRRLMQSIEVLGLTESILEHASQPMPTTVGSLDAIHLATALDLKTRLQQELVMTTHDVQLARAAIACGLEVLGADKR